MSKTDKVILIDFTERFSELLNKYWDPKKGDSYWEELTEDSINLINDFEKVDQDQGNFFSAVILEFLKSRQLLSESN